MRITQLKKSIAQMVEITSDKEVLEMIFNILDDRTKNDGKDILDDMTDEQLRGLDESIEQTKQGKVVPHETVMNRLRIVVNKKKKSKLV